MQVQELLRAGGNVYEDIKQLTRFVSLSNCQKIMSEIQGGINPIFHGYILIQNRQRAIENIINLSEINDVVILVGKGHETYQILKFESIHFDDIEEASKAILNRLKSELEKLTYDLCSPLIRVTNVSSI